MFKYLPYSSILFLLVLLSCTDTENEKTTSQINTTVNVTSSRSEEVHAELTLENDLFNSHLDSIRNNNNSMLDFEDFQLVFFEYKSDFPNQRRVGDTIFIEEEMGNRLEHFIIFNGNINAKYTVLMAYQQSIIAPTLDDKSIKLDAWSSLTNFEDLKQHEYLNLDFRLPNYHEVGNISDNFKLDFDSIKQDAIDARAAAYTEYGIKDTMDITHLNSAKNFNELNLDFYNSQVIIKIVQTDDSGEAREFVFVNTINWGC